MSSFVPRNPETLADRAHYTSEGLTTVACMDCLVTVEVRKNSEQQTAIQWSAEAQRQCPVLSGQEATYEGCPRLRASIDAAVREGRLPIGVNE
ncbi:MAG TPA: hypothetical protein VJ782_03755 [Aeromicrobium sp.]|nr:hypothetical protein [Aeromicrobium sp.]